MCHWGQQVDGCDTLGLDSTGEGSATITRSFIKGGVQGEEERDHFFGCVSSCNHEGCSLIYEGSLCEVMIKSMHAAEN